MQEPGGVLAPWHALKPHARKSGEPRGTHHQKAGIGESSRQKTPGALRLSRLNASEEHENAQRWLGGQEKTKCRTSCSKYFSEVGHNIVPKKQANKWKYRPQRSLWREGRDQEEHHKERRSPYTGRVTALFGLYGVRQRARKEKEECFTALLHHMTIDLLEKSFRELKKNAATGIDEVTWQEYDRDLLKRLPDLHERVHSGRYKAQPTRRSYIEKEDGSKRALGILAIEDKIVQQAVCIILNQIYETDFLGFSYGFRKGRSQHNALDALYSGITRKRIKWILDADIQGFFDNINHELLMNFIKKRIGDKRILRLINKWLKTGYMEEGRQIKQDIGTPQGAVVTPRTQLATFLNLRYL